jgi:sec-independent protein translocase protein TatA
MGTGIISPWHIAILVLVLLLVFGPKRLPEMGRSLGRGMREFKDGITHHHEQHDQPEPPQSLPAASSRERDSIS